ncbi:MAG: TIGR02206 family membrane protein [Planctomycetota bacterium]
MAGSFEIFGWEHCCMLALLAGGWWALVVAGKRVTGSPGEPKLRFALGLSILVLNLPWLAWKLMPERFELGTSLPLQLCDVAWMAAAWSLLSHADFSRLRHQLVYYWALGLSPLGVLTPDLEHGPATIDFWSFWVRHFLIIGAALLNLLAFGVRPSWKGYIQTVGVTAAILLPVTLFNVFFDTSYFYTGRSTSANPSPLDLLGEWPLRIVWIVLLTAVVFTLMTLPGRKVLK